jgi:hypothetical protein
MISKDEPLLPSLIEIASRSESKGSVLAGGLGLRLKREYLKSNGATELFKNLPEIRATSDIDLFLRIDLWVYKEEAIKFRAMLKELNYEPVEGRENWQFEKPQLGLPNNKLILDLMARNPLDEEKVKTHAPRVGVGKSTGIHGHVTPEAFAIEELPITVPIGEINSTVLIAHPYAYLNLKVQAANDWAEEMAGKIKSKVDPDSGERLRLKHVTDVYMIVGMLTQEELADARKLAKKYEGHSKAKSIRESARNLYGNREAYGCAAIRAHNGGELAADFDKNYEYFWDALSQALGVG